jgi:hypothetical protein
MAAKAPTRRQVQDALETARLAPDRLIHSRKTGRWEARLGFFYRHGRSAEGFAERVGTVLGAHVVNHGERWAAWPADSYWWVDFEFTTAED